MNLNNQRGMAILMVISTIAILTFLLADFTFETKLNKIKVYNFQDREQAKLNAEAGMALAMAKLRLYRQALDRKSTRLNSSHVKISYAVFCLKKKNRL